MENLKCFISILYRLKTSSKESVEGIENISKFKEYLHVERKAQQEFENLIDSSAHIDKGQLILVCGSVGDGKSHLLSFLRKNKKESMGKFDIYNDATESLDPKKTSVETLNDELNDFSDEKLGKNNKKQILAINLGTLTNFIDSEYGYRFTELKKYIKEKKILDQDLSNNEFDEKSFFQYISFADYHMFTLTNKGPKSKYIKEIFNKVVDARNDNPFYNHYKKTCHNGCINFARCPIKENYENLLVEQVKENIIQKLIKIMIKDKVIISTRALLNFIYDIVVDSSLDNISENELVNKIMRCNFKDYLKSLTVNIIYDNKDVSNIIASLNSIDPLNIRNEAIDSLIVKLNNTEKIYDYFKNYIKGNEVHHYYRMLVLDENSDIILNEKTKADQNELKYLIIKFFIRLANMMPKDQTSMFEDIVYKKFMKYLYYSNTKNRSEMKVLSNFVKDIVYRWNGLKLKEGQIQLSIGRNQSKFKIYENLEFSGKLSSDIKDEEELERFIKTINLTYVTKKFEDQCLEISIDYSLYELFVKVANGYIPNKKDKNNFINFVDFVKKLQDFGSQVEKILFDTKIGTRSRTYEFKVDEFGDYCMVEILI
jgi:DNA phosphorothioation-dependent restriction protein DptF